MAKTLWLFNLILFFSILKSDNVFSQAPNLINYQGVARNAAGNPLQNQTIYLRVNIRTGSSQGVIQFSETRSVKTNAWGLFAVQIGSPGFMSSIGTLAGVTWMQGDKFMEVEIDPTASNNYINLGSTQLLSVPYALNAVSAGTASPIGGAGGDLSGSYPNPTIANNKITSLKLADSSVVTSKVANYSITDIKIESVSGSKIIGDIIGNAKNVNGIVAIANGGTGASNTSDAKKNLLIDSVDNTTDLRKRISIATQNALNLKLNISDTLGTFSNRLKMSDTAAMLSNRLKISDTASMLSNRLKISDTANFVSNFRRTTTKIENTDLSKSTISGVSLGDNLKSLSASYGLSGTGFNGSADITDWKVDTSAISTKANVTGLLAGYATTGSVGNLDKLTDVKSGGENFSNSIIVGHKQTGTLSNASQNTVLGLEAFKSVTSATNNTVLGFNAMRSNLSGSNNVALGSHALLSNTTGSDNISVGYNAMLNNVSAIGNIAIGSNSLNSGTTGNYNVAVGHQSMVNNTTGDVNTALGYTSLHGNTTGRYNVALGVQALESNTTGNNNTAIGVGTLDRNTGGNENAILGAFAGRYIADGSTYNTTTSNSVLLGANIRVNGVGQSNQIVIGHNAIGNGSNTIQLGNTNITNVKTSGTITAGAVTYPNVDGNSGDLLTTNGSGVVSFIAPTLVREVADEFSATANQTSFTLTQTKAANSKVKMFINGVRISNTAYSVVGTTLTYIPANNGNTNLTLNDRIQFDYYY